MPSKRGQATGRIWAEDPGVERITSGSLTLTGAAQRLTTTETMCRGVLFRAPASDESGPNGHSFWVGDADVAAGKGIRVALSQVEGVFVPINDASKLYVKGTNAEVALYTILGL